jgi:hypothetical protein
MVMMQAAQDREGEDLATCLMDWHRSSFLLRNLLLDALMRSGLIEVLNVGMKDTVQLLLVKDEQVIQTLSPHTAQKALTDGIGSWRVRRCFQYLNAAGCGHARETGSKLAITIPNEILRRLSKRSCFPQLLCSPGIGRRSSDPHMDDSARVQIDDEDGKQRTKEKVGDLQEITCPDVFGMRMQEGGPILSSLSR